MGHFLHFGGDVPVASRGLADILLYNIKRTQMFLYCLSDLKRNSVPFLFLNYITTLKKLKQKWLFLIFYFHHLKKQKDTKKVKKKTTAFLTPY